MSTRACTLRVIGIDPGTTVGIFDVRWADVGTPLANLWRANAWQVVDSFELDATLVPLLTARPRVGEVRRVAIERFVIARGSMRGGRHARRTSERARDIDAAASRYGWPTVQRNASQVKAWATDERLERAGLLEVCKGMRHARDGARHALFAAVHDGGLPDPLSREWGR